MPVTEQRVDFFVRKAVAAVQEVEFENEREARHIATEAFDERYHGCGGSTGCEYIVDDQDLLTGFHGIRVDLERIGAVLKSVFHLFRRGWKLFRLANGNEARAD